MRLGYMAILITSILCTASVRADQIIRKGGEWRSTVTGITPEPRTIDLCFAPATQEQAVAKLATGKNCTKRDIRFEGDRAIIDIMCSDMSLKGTATMLGDSAYRADLTLGIGTGSDAKIVHTTTDAKWIGACKPGETPH